jgi:Uma2 family endonuclease
MPAAPKRATYHDLVNLPDHVVGEILDGELFASPRPASPHAFAASVLGSDLIGGFQRPPGDPGGLGGWWILHEPELHFGDDVLVPDIAGWRHARMPRVPDTAYFTLPPDWVCEVISPSTGRIDRGRKMAIYARAGVAHLWIVDPLAQTVESYRLAGDHWLLLRTASGDGPARIEPFEALEVTLARWWIASAA